MPSHHRKRTVCGALATATVTALVVLVASPASADPAPPDDASAAVQQLAELNHQAEVLTEQLHFAQDQLDARRAELDRAQADREAAAAAGGQALAVQQEFRGRVDQLASASFQGARLTQLSALLVSDSPEDFLDQMAALDLLAAASNEAMARLGDAVRQTRQAERAAAEATARATSAEQDAARIESDLAGARRDMDRQISVVQERLDELTEDERDSYTDGGVTDFVPGLLPGSGAAATAVEAALSRQGSPYRWAATGPGAFDCSGLMVWSYRQAGVSLPRSSRAQAQEGSSVGRAQLQPGDLIFLYSPVSHVGMYVGDGRYVNAPQGGDVVKVVTVPWGDVTAMRRVA